MNGENGFYTVEEIKGRLSISTAVFGEYRPIGEQTLKELARNGITSIELFESPEQFDMADRQSMKYIGEVCRSCDIRITAYHAHKINFSDLSTDEKRTTRVDLCRRQIDTMLELGGKVWGSHASITDGILLKCYEELARHIEGSEAVIAIENFKDAGQWAEDRVVFLDKIKHPQVGMILDVGHARDASGTNPLTVPGGPTRVLGICGRHVRHVHLHGFKEGEDHFPPLIEGDTMQWVELFGMLRSIRYSGFMNFEPKGEPKHCNSIAATALFPERIIAMEARTRSQNNVI